MHDVGMTSTLLDKAMKKNGTKTTKKEGKKECRKKERKKA